MKICISLRSTAPTNLKEGNLRSEARWERQALEACIQSPLVEEVYTTGCHWVSGNRVSTKYKGKISASVSRQTVLLIQDCNLGIINRHPYKAVIVNIFSGPWIEQIPEVNKLSAQYGPRFLFSIGFPALYKNESAMSHLKKFLPWKDIVLLPQPGIPEPRYKDCFDNKTILWAWRLIFFSQITVDPGITWSLEQLRKDESLNLYVLTGWKKEEVKDFVNEEVVNITESLNDYFWSREKFKPYLDLKSRVHVEYHLGWDKVLDKYGEAKVLAYYGKYFGGPPLEASTFGVPFVGCSIAQGAMIDCPGYLYTPNANEAYAFLDRLMEDREFYTKTALSYHQYACENYTFEAFCKNIHSILEERGVV